MSDREKYLSHASPIPISRPELGTRIGEERPHSQSDFISELKLYTQHYPSSVLFSLIFSFAVGLLFAPWSAGFLYLIIFIIIYEIVYAYIYRDFSSQNCVIRIGIVVASLFGFIVGRALLKDSRPLRGSYKDKDQDLGCKWHKKKKYSRKHPHFSNLAIQSLLCEEDEHEKAKRRRRALRTDTKPNVWILR